MSTAQLPSLAIGNGRLLVTLDAFSTVLSACWPCIDSPNQFAEFSIRPVTLSGEAGKDSDQVQACGYVDDTNIAFGRTKDGLIFKDLAVDFNSASYKSDVHVRQVAGPHQNLALYLIPELDGRPGAQTVYWDEQSEALLAFCRDKWVAIGCQRGKIYDFHCGRRYDESSGQSLQQMEHLPGERIAFRHVDGTLRIRKAAQSTNVFSVFAHTREAVLTCLDLVRGLSWNSFEQQAKDRSISTLTGLRLSGWSPTVNRILKRSCLVLDLLTNRDTGGTIAGPDAQSGIQSAPGYAAVWGRDAAWTMLGALALGCETQVEKMLQFACKTQAPEGLWIQRHHTDYTTASSWGLHQIDETGILLHSMACHHKHTGSNIFLHNNWDCISRAADFLVSITDNKTSLPFKSIDLWEEREGVHLYTAASVIAGLRAASYLAQFVKDERKPAVSQWTRTANNIQASTLLRFWDAGLGRYITSIESSSGLPMVDQERPELSAVVQDGSCRPQTAIPQYPNWRDGRILEKNYSHDISVLSLAVPFAILPLDDERIVNTVDKLYCNLWNESIGGLCRYEGDSYGGGNPWPLATLWLAIYEGARGNTNKAIALIEWVLSHTTEAGLIPEQVHRTNGNPIAAVPLSWSHGMLALAVSATLHKNIWTLCT